MREKEQQLKVSKSKTNRRSIHGKRIRVDAPLSVRSDTTYSIRNSELRNQNGSTLSSETSLEKTFYFGNHRSFNTHAKSDTQMLKTVHGEIQDQSIHTGFEQMQKRARNVPAYLAGSFYGYKSEVYVAAAAIFERLAARKDVGECLIQYPSLDQSAPQPVVASKQTKRQAFELAYETLKYQELLEEVLADSGYFFSHPAGEDMSALIMVMLFDFQNRKWGPRCQIQGNVDDNDVKEIDNNLLDHRVHLAAALARNRVKNQAQSIDYALPEIVRKQEKCARQLPQYSWINTMKASFEDVLNGLNEQGYVEFIDPETFLPRYGKYFRRDRHCDDVIVFPADQKDVLKVLDVVVEGKLVLQDKTSSLAVASIMALITADDDYDLIHTEVASGLTTAHLAAALFQKTKPRREKMELMFGHHTTNMNNRSAQVGSVSVPKVIAYGAGAEESQLELTAFFEYLGISNIQLMSENFHQCDPKRDGIDHAKAILVTPRCTRTAVSNPIEFMLNEGDSDNLQMLHDLSTGELHKRAAQAGVYHSDGLKNALQFRSIQAVVYVTRSIHSQENEEVVSGAIKWHRTNGDGSRPFLISPPTLALLTSDIKADKLTGRSPTSSASSSLKRNFLRMRQSSQMNGCFIAVLTREIDPNDMMKRNALQGLITPVIVSNEENGDPINEAFSPERRQARKAHAKVTQLKKVRAVNPHLFHTQASIAKAANTQNNREIVDVPDNSPEFTKTKKHSSGKSSRKTSPGKDAQRSASKKKSAV